jgi:hypothetical protein
MRLADILTPLVRATNASNEFIIEKVALPLYRGVEEAQSRVNAERASREVKRLGVSDELMASLNQTHAGQWVGVENGKIVATGDSMQELLPKIGDHAPRIIKVPARSE